jgi:trehalose/maltose hydrolase-like predicted phosphorylase
VEPTRSGYTVTREVLTMGRRFVVAVAVAAALGGGAPVASAAENGFVLSTNRPGGKGFAPAFVGNGYLAGRQPADGQGYAVVDLPGSSDDLPTQSQVQGFYAEASEPDTGLIERRAALPAWSTLRYDDGSGPYALKRGKVRRYRQQLDMRTGTLSTDVTWTSPAGRTARLRYDVTPDRALPHAALVRLRITPRFDGRVIVTDALDGSAAELTRATGHGAGKATQWVDLRSQGLDLPATVASTLRVAGRRARVSRRAAHGRTVAQSARIRVHRGRTVTVVKSVGIAVKGDAGTEGPPHARAIAVATREDARGYRAARAASDRAWARLWRGDIAVKGDARLQAQVRSAMFALLASTRADQPWAPSPGGLSSDGYNGHVFWDSETWMYPTLLALQPAIARASLQYRRDRLRAARRNARKTGYRGARFPWESAWSGAEETPSCCNTGKWEVHVNADIALAFWQDWLATGDRRWLARHAWPVVAGIADFWVSRSQANPDGTRSIDCVIPPDEYAECKRDSVYTNFTAAEALRIAGRVAALTGHPADPRWAQVADQLRIPYDAALGVHPEFDGYHGETIKQADVTLLAYPWEAPQTPQVTAADVDHYVPRTDPGGPSMTDAIHAIVTSQLGTPGCAAFTFTRRSIDPFMRAPYEQFSEARTGGAFTFTTGAGGFLQEFLYGYSGWRWRASGVHLDPSLPPQLRAITLNAVHWRGRTLRVAIRRDATTVTLLSGPPVAVDGRPLTTAAPLQLPTRMPDTTPTDDLARCRPAATSPQTAEPPEAAVDGTDITSWQADKPGTRLTVDLGRAQTIGSVQITRPPVVAIAGAQLGDEAKTIPTPQTAATIELSADGRRWAPAGTPGTSARYVRITAGDDASERHPLVVGELHVRAP